MEEQKRRLRNEDESVPRRYEWTDQATLEKFEEALRLEPREGEQPTLVEKTESLRKELQ